MGPWIAVADLDAIRAGGAIRVAVDGIDVALFRTGDGIYAIEDGCPHQGASLSRGRLNGRIVACPSHGIRFDLTTGCATASPALCVRSYEVRVDAGVVLLRKLR